MSSPLRALNRGAILALADLLEAAGGGGPLSREKVRPHVPAPHLDAVCAALAEFAADGMAPRHTARMLRLLAEERASAQRLGDALEFVWSPHDLNCVDARDTAVVARELFRSAQHSVLVVTYVLDANTKAEAIFGELAERMDAHPALVVRCVVNVARAFNDSSTPEQELLRAASKRLREQVWPGKRRPEFYYDPRSLNTDMQQRASMHAKCIVVDRRRTLLTSANLTEAAQTRNIEAGVLVDEPRFAERIETQFGQMVETGWLRKL